MFVSGTTGFDYATMTIADDVAEQAAQCLRNIAAALAEAGATFADVVRVTYIVPGGAADFRPAGRCCAKPSATRARPPP